MNERRAGALKKDSVVIVALDGSDFSERSLAYVGMFAGVPNLTVELLTIEEGGGEPSNTARMQRYLDEKAKELHTAFGIAALGRVKQGIPYLIVLHEAARENVALIALSTHGQNGAERNGVGSVADLIIRGAGCPSLVVGPSCEVPAGPIDSLIVPLDGSDLAVAVLPAAELIARGLGARIKLLQVVDASGVEATEKEDDFAGGEAAARTYLAKMAATLATSVQVECIVGRGELPATLLAELSKHPRGLVVMSSHGGQGFRSYALGSVTDQVLIGSVPVLVVGPGQASRLEGLFAA